MEEQSDFVENDVVALLEDVPSDRLARGQLGTVVYVYDPQTFEVEFVDREGQTYGLVTLKSHQLLELHFKPVPRIWIY